MPTFTSKARTTAKIKEVRKVLARILSDLEFVASVAYDRDNSLGWEIPGSGDHEFTDTDASDLGFGGVSEMAARLNTALDAVTAIKSNYDSQIIPAASGA